MHPLTRWLRRRWRRWWRRPYVRWPVIIAAVVLVAPALLDDRVRPGAGDGVDGAAAVAAAPGPGALVPAGWRAVAIPGWSGGLDLAPGAVVDLHAAMDTTAELVAGGAIVVAVTPEVLTVAVRPADVGRLATALTLGVVVPAWNATRNATPPPSDSPSKSVQIGLDSDGESAVAAAAARRRQRTELAESPSTKTPRAMR